MSAGLFHAHLFYPDLLHVVIPSAYLLSPKNRRARVRVNKQYHILQLLDFTNSMMPSSDNPVLFFPHHDIPSTYTSESHYRIGLVTQAELDNILEEFKTSGKIDPRIVHRATFDTQGDGLYRVFETRYATDLLVSYEIPDINTPTAEDKEFYMEIVDEFVHIYRYVSGDYRPRLLKDCREPMSLDFGATEYEEDERDRPLDEKLGSGRQIGFQQRQDKTSFDRQPTTEVAAKDITERISAFLRGSDQIAPGQEFLSTARHAAFQTKNFKYAVLEAFISAETMVVDFIRKIKITRGVSQSKMKDWKDEVSIGYMLNIEIPMLVEGMAKNDRQTLGEVNRVRRMRNDIVHEGKRPTESEAQFAVKAIEKLHDALQRWAHDHPP